MQPKRIAVYLCMIWMFLLMQDTIVPMGHTINAGDNELASKHDNTLSLRKNQDVLSHLLPYSTKDPSVFEPLFGVWEFSYTIEHTFTDTFTLDTLEKDANGEYFATGKRSDGTEAVVSYEEALTVNGDEYSGVYMLVLPGDEYFDEEFFVFTVSSNSASGSYYIVAFSVTMKYSCTGKKTQDIDPPEIPDEPGGEPGENHPPDTPKNPDPSDGAADVPSAYTFAWDGGDPDTGDTVTYDFYIGTGEKVDLQKSGLDKAMVNVEGMTAGTVYSWKIVSRDHEGKTTEGPLWHFTTADGSGCALSLLFNDDEESLDVLRTLRDKKLNKTALGRAFIRLYYRYDYFISSFLLSHPALKEKFRKVLKQLIPLIDEIERK